MKRPSKTKSLAIPRRIKLKPEQVHKPAKSYDRKKEKHKLKKLLKNV